jgi:uncharacterized SAM-binding protein YcdF (DUF218 family)
MTAPLHVRRGNPVGIASLAFGLLLLVAGIVVQALSPVLPSILAETGMSFRTIPFLFAIPQAVIAMIATALGVVGLLLRDRARVAAIIGTTLGASHLIVSLVGSLAAVLVAAGLG